MIGSTIAYFMPHLVRTPRGHVASQIHPLGVRLGNHIDEIQGPGARDGVPGALLGELLELAELPRIELAHVAHFGNLGLG